MKNTFKIISQLTQYHEFIDDIYVTLIKIMSSADAQAAQEWFVLFEQNQEWFCKKPGIFF